MNTILGQNLGLFADNQLIHGSGATSGDTCFAFATQAQISLNVDTVDITSKDSGSWADSLPNRKSFSISTDCLYSEDYDALMLLAINRTVFKVKWCSAINHEANNTVSHEASHTVGNGHYAFYEGNVFIDSIQASAGNDEAGNYSVNMTGKGQLKVIDKDGNTIEGATNTLPGQSDNQG
jgi:TP901-1 family phage major tail protein